MTVVALPHSGTSGSPRARRSPEHFAVRRALHRLLAPRHPPAALCSLIIQFALALRRERGMGWSILGRAEAREDAIHLVTVVASRCFCFPAVPPTNVSVSRQGRSSLADYAPPVTGMLLLLPR